MRSKILVSLLALAAWNCGTSADEKVDKAISLSDTSLIFSLLDKGDSLYAQKKDYTSFADAMMYYDSAARMAENVDDIPVKGYVAFSKASVYNAWNKEPEKTIALFKEAENIYSKGRDKESIRRSYYCRYLIAHAFDNEKGKDSLSCVQTLLAVQDSLKKLPRDLWSTWIFLPDLAWVATNANNYALAEDLLANLTERNKIVNDPTTNNYLDHYYLTRARIDVFKNGNGKSPYLDSLSEIFEKTKLNFEKLYYGQNLSALYAVAGNYERAYSVATENELVSARVNDSAGIGSLQNRLLQTRLESEKKDKILLEAQHKNRIRLLWLLGLSLAIISVFSYRFFKGQRKYKEQSVRLEQTNKHLDEKVREVDLISKEMQHRIKNNLQMIQSLVYMQQRQSSSEEVKANMQQMGLRIESISSLHQQLSEKDGELIDLKQYVTGMLNTVVELVDRNNRVLTHFDIDNLALPNKVCFPLGLVLNEWITNSIKYARVPGSTLSIYINIKHAENKLTVEYYDSGIPIPCTEVKKGLGLKIIQLLKTQMNAQLELKTENCFYYRMLIGF